MEEMGGRDRVMGALVITLQINLSCSKPDLARRIFSFFPQFQCSRFFFCQKDICGRASGDKSTLDESLFLCVYLYLYFLHFFVFCILHVFAFLDKEMVGGSRMKSS